MKPIFKDLPFRFSLRINGKVYKRYRTLSGARRGYDSFYNNGKVLPYDSVTIFDRMLLCFYI